MICPTGYLNWQEMRSLLGRLAQRIYLAEALEVLDEDPQIAIDEKLPLWSLIYELEDHRHARKRLNLKSANFDIDLIAFWMMNRLDEESDEAAMCSPSGNLLRTTHPIFFHPDQFFYFYLSFPLRETIELRRIYEEVDAGRMSSNDLWSRYSCIDGETGKLKQKNQTLLNFEHYFGDGDEVTGKSAFDEFVRPFLGWYVVFENTFGEYDDYELIKSFGLANKQWTPPDTLDPKPIKRRGPKASPAKAEFERLYPNGLPENLSAEAVAAELTEKGFPITGRSIQNYDNAAKK